MKFKTTSKAIRSNYSKIIRVGYCELQHLLTYEDAVAYNAGGNGWNYDVYSFGGVAIVTGYQPIGTYNVDYKLTRKLDDKAGKIASYENKWSHNRKKAQLAKMIQTFINEAK